MAVTEFTSAPAGTGKTAMRCARYLAHEFLPGSNRTLYTNYPVNIDAMVAYVTERYPVMVAASLRERIKIIPQSVLDSWAKHETGPEAYFGSIDLDNCRIAIDEIHTYLGASTPKDKVQEWRLFLGTLRHRGCEFECLTQNESKVHKAIKDEAGLKRYLFNTENKPDPFFGIRMEDWYELRAKLTGRYLPWIFETVYTEVHGKWVETKALASIHPLSPELFPLYDSYSTPHQGGNVSKGREHPYQSLSTVRLLLWFLRRNWFRVSTRFATILLVVWLCFGGGMATSINGFISLMQHMKPPTDTPAAATATAAPQTSKSAPTSPTKPATRSQPPPVTGRGVFDSAPTTATAPTDAAAQELANLRTTLAAKEAEIEKLKTDAARFSEIVALMGNTVTLRSGITVDIGEQIPVGPLKGRTLKGISHAKRRVILDNNTVLPLSAP